MGIDLPLGNQKSGRNRSGGQEVVIWVQYPLSAIIRLLSGFSDALAIARSEHYHHHCLQEITIGSGSRTFEPKFRLAV